MTQDTQLIHFDTARQHLALASSIDEVKQIRNQAEAIRMYIKQQKGSFEMQNQAAEIKLRAERRAGEMLKEIERQPGERTDLTPRHDGMRLLPTYTSVLKENDIASKTAHRWQLEAEIPEEKFEQFIAETKAAAEELTSIAALKIAQRMKRESEVQNTPPLPNGVFDVIYADPPWRYEFSKVEAWGIETHYDTLSLDEIKSYKDDNGTAIQDKFAKNAVLFIWTPSPKLQEALEVIQAWGFEYTTGAVWIKDRLGMGYWWMQKHEMILLAKRGDFPAPNTGNRPPSVIESPWNGHSRKPEIVYEMIEQMCPIPSAYKESKQDYYLELFKRGSKRPFWVGWGKEYDAI